MCDRPFAERALVVFWPIPCWRPRANAITSACAWTRLARLKKRLGCMNRSALSEPGPIMIIRAPVPYLWSWTCGKAPGANLQAPGKHQHLSFKRALRPAEQFAVGRCLRVGVSLDLGAWLLRPFS